MKVSAAIITTGILCLEGLSSFTGSGTEKYVSARKPAVQAVCSVKSCRKTGAHKHHTTVKHHTYNCGVSSCKITKKHTHKRYSGHHRKSHRSSHHGRHHR